MTNVKLTHEIVSETILDANGDFEFNGENYAFETQLPTEMTDDFKHFEFIYIYKRKSDGKYFRITITLIRYGYEWYEYETDYNDCELIEVEKREVTVTTWEAVK